MGVYEKLEVKYSAFFWLYEKLEVKKYAYFWKIWGVLIFRGYEYLEA